MPTSEPSLDSLLELSPDQLAAALDRLVARGAAALPLLRNLEDRLEDKGGRKLVRRALHRLRSQGVEVHDLPPEPRGSVLHALDEEAEQGVVTPLDPLGAQAVFLVSPVRGGARLYEALLSDVQGVLRLERRVGRRRDARAFLRELRERARAAAVPVPGAQVRALVVRAALHGVSPAVEHGVLRELSDLESARTPGEVLRAALGSQTAELSEADLEGMVRTRQQRGTLPLWPLVGPALQEALKKLEEVERSPIVLPPAQQAERQAELMREVIALVLDAPTRERMAARLEESAPFFEHAGDREGALATLRLAAQVREASDPGAVAYLRLLVELSLDLAWRQSQEESKGRLIVP